ncbi:Argonaute complex, subunit Arb1 [Xylariales sp. PMI_506]|nr:Argonaute complex, subunit Arb1 [Xylariales sp. PMI_506]
MADGGMLGYAESDIPLIAEMASKKKNKSKKRVGKTRRRITGFEEFYADPPMTSSEFQGEKAIYSPEYPFSQRIEECIQRYRQKRRWDSQRTFLFDNYLFLGGIDTSQRQFQGLDPLEAKPESANAHEIRVMTARDVIHGGCSDSKFYDPEDADGWVVDFEGIVKGFLSDWVPKNFHRNGQSDLQDIQEAANIITNFLNYVLLHDVCPEYKSQIIAARGVCEIAPTEVSHCREVFHHISRDSFNAAARFLFSENGVFQAVEFNAQRSDAFSQLVIFRMAIMHATQSFITQDDPRQIRVINTLVQDYEVVSVRKNKNHRELVEMFKMQRLPSLVKPCGIIKVQRTMLEHAYSNLPRSDEVDSASQPTETFIIDDAILHKIQPGIKMKLEVCELNVGIRFIKAVLDIRVSFDTLLPQSLMYGWKTPVDNERPAPSVHDHRYAEEDGYVEENDSGDN